MEIIEIKDLSFCYTDSDKLILNNINLKINNGDFILLCGESGCGKTTLLRHLKEELTPYGNIKGFVVNKGVNVGYVMQNPDSQIVTDKVWHELAFGLENMGIKRDEIKLRCSEVAAFFGINSWYHKNTYELSGGQKQLLNLASVLVMKPDVIVLDEPLSQLDPLASAEFVGAIARINSELGIAVVMSEHNLNEVMPYAKRVVVMDNGSIIAEDKPQCIMAKLREKSHPMQIAMPAGVRIHSAVSGLGDSPLTVTEAKIWLNNYANSKYYINVNENISKESVIKGKELFFAYKKDKDIVRNMDIDIKKGEVFAILGGNGSGKTTTLRVLAGLNKAYSGNLNIKGKVLMLPQSPIALFTERNILLDLKSTGKNIDKAVKLLEIESLLEQNPNDLSGGELQRCAICKLLLLEPDILLLDEPTKGIDSFMKGKLGYIIRNLGITVVMVSHDIEFCSRFADRCAMCFDGQLVNPSFTHSFFTDNFFYTTPACKIASGIVDNGITTEEIISAFNKNENIVVSNNNRPKPPDNMTNKREERLKATLNKRILLSSLIILFLIPISIWSGITFLDNRKYYVISFAIILMTMAPFFILFESRRMRAREIVIIASMCVICVAGRIVFAPFPQVKPVSALVIISGICLGSESGFIIGALSGFCSNFYFGQGPWTPWQMFAFGIIGFLAGALRLFFIKNNMPRRIPIAIFAFISVLLIYGTIMNTSSVLMTQDTITLHMILTMMVSGFVFDLVHAVSTVCFIYLFANPLVEKITRVKKKFGLL